VLGILKIGSCELFSWAGYNLLFSWSLLISWVVRITGMSHQHLVSHILYLIHQHLLWLCLHIDPESDHISYHPNCYLSK
jgi:hypothetical protein